MLKLPKTNADIIDIILQFEGGYTNNPHDHGGPTNYGITAEDLGCYLKLGTVATPRMVKDLTREQAVEIYLNEYIVNTGFDKIKNEMVLRLILVDTAVLFGKTAACSMTTSLQTTEDEAGKCLFILGLRYAHIANIVARNPSQVVFLKGWINRTTELLDIVTQLVGEIPF